MPNTPPQPNHVTPDRDTPPADQPPAARPVSYARSASYVPDMLERQHERNRAPAARDGVAWAGDALGRWEDAGRSGLTLDRAGFAALLVHVERGDPGFDRVYVTDGARLSRGAPEEVAGAVARLARAGVAVTVGEGG